MEVETRRSKRKVQAPNKEFLPEAGAKPKKARRSSSVQQRKNAGDVLPNGTPFCCCVCRSRYIIDPSKRGCRPVSKRAKKTRLHNSPRYRVNAVSGEQLTLCNACGNADLLASLNDNMAAVGLAYDRLTAEKKASAENPAVTENDKINFAHAAAAFAETVAAETNEETGKRLFCSKYNAREPCGCVQKFIANSAHAIWNNSSQARERAGILIKVSKKAEELSKQKSYDIHQATNNGRLKNPQNVGLGNGRKKSAEYSDFVLRYRKILKDTYRLCEKATQRLLLYSNNFIHKRLKTKDNESRVERLKGKEILGQLEKLEEMARKACCNLGCVKLSETHPNLLTTWRQRAGEGQQEMRRVLAEMLTPTGGDNSNCHRFISRVTGCSQSTIQRVRDQMLLTGICDVTAGMLSGLAGGDREPPPHGLKLYYQERPRSKEGLSPSQPNSLYLLNSAQVASPSDTSPATVSSTSLADEAFIPGVSLLVQTGRNTSSAVATRTTSQTNAEPSQVSPAVSQTATKLVSYCVPRVVTVDSVTTLTPTAAVTFIQQLSAAGKPGAPNVNIADVLPVGARSLESSASSERVIRNHELSSVASDDLDDDLIQNGDETQNALITLPGPFVETAFSDEQLASPSNTMNEVHFTFSPSSNSGTTPQENNG